MVYIDENPDYKKLYSILVKTFSDYGYFDYGHNDETFCSMRVFETAKDLIKRIDVDVDVEVILTASILHDIGKSDLDLEIIKSESNPDRTKIFETHVKKSVPLVKEILEKEGYSSDFIEKVCFLVGHHNKKIDGLQTRSLELQILQDADILADFGSVFFLRVISYGAIYKRPLIDSIKYFLEVEDRVFEDDILNLNVSKQLVQENLAFLSNLKSELSNFLDSELL